MPSFITIYLELIALSCTQIYAQVFNKNVILNNEVIKDNKTFKAKVINTIGVCTRFIKTTQHLYNSLSTMISLD